MDCQSFKWGNNRLLNSFDGNKKVKGIKRYIIVDKNLFLLAVMFIASTHDSKATELLLKTRYYFLCPIKVILVDGYIRGEIIENVKK